MEDSTSREKVLKKVRDALIEKTELPYPVLDQESPVFEEISEPLDVAFAETLVQIGGKFVYCESDDEFTSLLKSFILDKNWGLIFTQDPVIQALFQSAGIPFESRSEAITEIKLGITRCEFLIARLGSVMVSSRLNPGRRVIAFPDTHLVLAYSSQLVPDLKQALAGIKRKYRDQFPSMVSIITGPSRTADIEKTLVMGAHGPKELYVFLIDDSTT
jgi:L-lactate dehydrogenase complex protein LldG